MSPSFNCFSFMLQVTEERPLLRSLLLLLVAGGVTGIYEFQQISGWQEATGEVVAREQAFGSEGVDKLAISIRFSTNGRTLHFTTGLNFIEEIGLYTPLAQGEKVSVLFNPEQPHMARLNRLPRTYPMTGSIGLLGLFLLLGRGAVKLVQTHRAQD